MPRLELFAHPGELPDSLEGWQPVVIDVLRATSTLVTALAHGAEGVFPVETVEQAFARGREWPDALLAGERGALRVEGFALGNSPLEMTPERVAGRRLVFTTSNGTAALARASRGGTPWCLSFLNLSAVAEGLRHLGKDVAVVCAGTDGRLSPDDLAVAGALVERLPEFEGNGPARAARAGFRNGCEDLYRLLAETGHGRYLVQLGMQEDVRWCAQLDRYAGVPVLALDGWARLHPRAFPRTFE